MNLWGDLKSANAMYLKAVLFLVSGIACAVGLLLQSPDLRTAFLLAVLIWSFCRLYYFLFYVIERYIDPSFRFDGIFSAIRYLLKKAKTKGVTDDSNVSRK
ncbi:MAG: hypothetical protein H8F28_16655 [Fibrella sp.]|nr:hypothetical protein [Armatimonadota bacterium]